MDNEKKRFDMRTPTEALKEIRDRLTYFCLRTDGRYDPPWATELVGIIDEAVTDSHTINNAAAMREALKTIHDKVNSIDEECGVDPVEIRDIARTALSAPARNCDVMSRSICMKHFSTIYEGNRDGLCDVQTEREKNIHLYYIKFNKWLFAPAEERKGEKDDCART